MNLENGLFLFWPFQKLFFFFNFQMPNQLIVVIFNIPLNYWALGECIKFIAKWINRNVAIVIYWVLGKNAGYSLKDGLTWVGNGSCAITCNNNSIGSQILLVWIGRNKSTLIRHFPVVDIEPEIERSHTTKLLPQKQALGSRKSLYQIHIISFCVVFIFGFGSIKRVPR